MKALLACQPLRAIYSNNIINNKCMQKCTFTAYELTPLKVICQSIIKLNHWLIN